VPVDLRQYGRVVVRARISLWPSDRAFRLPASGTPSMLFRFGGEGGELLGGKVTA